VWQSPYLTPCTLEEGHRPGDGGGRNKRLNRYASFLTVSFVSLSQCRHVLLSAEGAQWCHHHVLAPLSCTELQRAALPCAEMMQARVAALLKEHPSAGQAFCRLLVAPYLHYIEGGRGEPAVRCAQHGDHPCSALPFIAFLPRCSLLLSPP
jgi:hypothetical protein